MATYLGNHKYNVYLGGKVKFIITNAVNNQDPDGYVYIPATTVNNDLLTTEDGLYLKLREEQ